MKCKNCNGTGTIQLFTSSKACESCNGIGETKPSTLMWCHRGWDCTVVFDHSIDVWRGIGVFAWCGLGSYATSEEWAIRDLNQKIDKFIEGNKPPKERHWGEVLAVHIGKIMACLQDNRFAIQQVKCAVEPDEDLFEPWIAKCLSNRKPDVGEYVQFWWNGVYGTI